MYTTISRDFTVIEFQMNPDPAQQKRHEKFHVRPESALKDSFVKSFMLALNRH